MTPISRQEAKAQGLKHYFTGLACKREHVAERRVSNKNCCQCETERSQRPDVKAYDAKRKQTPKARVKQSAYRQANPEKLAASNAAYYAANAEKIMEQHSEYRQANAESVKKQQAEYYKAHAEKFVAYRLDNLEKTRVREAGYRQANAEQIAAKKAAYYKANPHLLAAQKAKRKAAKIQATPPWADFEAIKAVYHLCAEVTRITGEKNHVDHIIPLISKKVCGLHVAANLQILTASDNLKKGNKLLPMYEMP